MPLPLIAGAAGAPAAGSTLSAVLPSLVSGGLSFLGNTIGGLFGMSAQKDANRQAIKLQQLQNAFNLKMWNLQNEYNDPKNQVKRLLDAGLNPWMTGVTPGMAGSLASAPAPQIIPVDAMGKAIQQFGESAAHFTANLPNMVKTSADAENQLINNQTQLLENITRIENMKKSGVISDKEAEKLGLDNKFTLDTFSTKQDLLTQQLEFIKNQVVESQLKQRNMELLNQNQEFQNVEMNPLRKQELQTQIATMTSNIQIQWRRLAMDQYLTEAQVQSFLANARKTTADAIGSENQNKLFSRTWQFMANQIKYTSEQAKFGAVSAQKKSIIDHNAAVFDKVFRQQQVTMGKQKITQGYFDMLNSGLDAAGKVQDISTKHVQFGIDLMDQLTPW